MAILGQALPDGPSEAGPISTGLPSTKGFICGLSLFSIGSLSVLLIVLQVVFIFLASL